MRVIGRAHVAHGANAAVSASRAVRESHDLVDGHLRLAPARSMPTDGQGTVADVADRGPEAELPGAVFAPHIQLAWGLLVQIGQQFPRPGAGSRFADGRPAAAGLAGRTLDAAAAAASGAEHGRQSEERESCRHNPDPGSPTTCSTTVPTRRFSSFAKITRLRV